MLVDDENAFDHAGEDGFHARAVGFEAGQALRKVLRQPVEQARDRADLVVAVVGCRPREIAGRVALRRAAASSGGAGRAARRTPMSGRCAATIPVAKPRSASVRTHASCRSTSVNGTARRTIDKSGMPGLLTGMATYIMSVSIVALWRRDAAHPGSPGVDDFRARAVILDRLAAPRGSGPSRPTTRPSASDEGDARRQDAAECVRLRVELRLAGRRAVREELGGHARVARQLVLDALLQIPAHRRRHERRRRRDGKRCGRERGQEDLGSERHGRSGRQRRSSSLYPNCLIVTMASARNGTLSRSRLMWTSTVRVPPVY